MCRYCNHARRYNQLEHTLLIRRRDNLKRFLDRIGAKIEYDENYYRLRTQLTADQWIRDEETSTTYWLQYPGCFMTHTPTSTC